ncbi:hypothetical protein EGI22_04795 [Lacihabitans sp. LS3-19]|uniref:hypothetical protein n=1 Tax=Lacihabitans sp. LS3-19 TaxID=2487335 RepID=UPI0020CED94B|nr:hypothetical protein [Lacihabitans sp. LS3-19]MCP9767217.1 hypothetical protein [Lacihabitans sp. LS3-19]
MVVEKGKAVSGFEIGEEVYGFLDHGLGSHADYYCIKADRPILKKPENISHEQAAAALEGAHYAYYFLNKVALKPNDNVLVNGATGAIGNAAIQYLIEKGINVTFTYPTDSYEKIKKN